MIRGLCLRMISAVALSGALATALHAQTPDLWEITARICSDREFARTDLAPALSQFGWAAAVPAEFQSATIERLAAASMVNSSAGKDVVAARWLADWDLALKSARNSARIMPDPSSPTQRAYFVHPQTGSVLLVFTEVTGTTGYQTCQISATAAAMPRNLQKLKAQDVKRPPISQLVLQRRTNHPQDGKVTFFYFDEAAIAKVPAPQLPIQGVVKTYLPFPPNEVRK